LAGTVPCAKKSTGGEIGMQGGATNEGRADFRAVFECSPLATVVLDFEGRVTMWNAAAERLFGWSAVEVMGRPPPYVPEELMESFLGAHRQAFEGGELSEVEVRRVRRDGAQLKVNVARAPLRDGAGAVYALVGILTDVTERARGEEKERRSQANFRALIERAPDAIVVHRGGHVLFVNPKMASMLGYERPQEMVGISVLSFVHPDFHDVVEKRIDSLRSVERSAPLEELFVRRDGTEVPVEVIGIAIDYDGAPAALAHARDLTERKHLEEQLRTADRLASVGRLAAAVGHEINNPLAYIIGNLDSAAKLVASPFAEGADEARARRVRALLAETREGAERVRQIVRDLRVFSRTDAEERAAVDLHAVLDSCLAMADNEIRHRARLVKSYGDVPLVVGSEARLGQVFLNLILNAAQAIPEAPNGREQLLTITTRASADAVDVAVTDTGVGIPRELLGRIFEPFFTTKPVGQGTGLGLSICHRLVTDLGGTIDVTSEVGHGTTVRVCLPIAPPTMERAVRSVPPPPPAAATKPESRVRHLLIVDDEPRVAQTIARLLDGHEVTIATSGRAAIAMLEKTPFDVILCDLMMRDVSGVDVYESVRASRPGLEKRIVFMTGGAFTPRASEFLESVDCPCIEKPFQIEDLLVLFDRVDPRPC
jgi:PAS domain S-box-containing protein